MRVSTVQLYDSGTSNLLRIQSDLVKTQTQISTGRRILTPSDDPVASSVALLTSQAKAVNEQYAENQGTAESQLSLVEDQLRSVGDLLQNVRERAVQLGNASLSDRERTSIAEELRQRFAELLGLSNAQNAQGQYTFSGFQGNSRPFAVSSPVGAPPFAAGNPLPGTANPYVAYAGDDGERLLQVDSSRQIGISASGADVFMRIRQGNGSFATADSGNLVTPGTNRGSGIVDQGLVRDVTKWNSALTQPQDYRVVFKVDPTGVLKYTLADATSTNSLYDNLAIDPTGTSAAQWKTYTTDQAISFSGLDASVVAGGDLGVSVAITGTPADGDTFSVKASQNQSVFDTLQNLIAAAATTAPAGSSGNTTLSNQLTQGLSNLDQALDNVLRIRSSVGARLSELDALTDSNANQKLQYEQRLSDLQDLDYASAISELNKQQLQLEAAQKSFSRVTSLSLFDLL